MISIFVIINKYPKNNKNNENIECTIIYNHE